MLQLINYKKTSYTYQSIYIKHKYFIKKKSYAMDSEDAEVINPSHNKTEKGYYVDVGCYHPIHRNNTYLLHKKNWNGINIDTSEFSIDLFDFMRPMILIIIVQFLIRMKL